MSSQAEKALAACRRYDELMTSIRRDTELISSAECDRVVSTGGEVDISYIPDGKKTHLQDVFDGYEDEGVYGVVKCHYLPEEALEIIGDCEGCKRAFEAVQRRKLARKQLGAVKRAIRIIARTGAEA